MAQSPLRRSGFGYTTTFYKAIKIRDCIGSNCPGFLQFVAGPAERDVNRVLTRLVYQENQEESVVVNYTTM